MYLNKKAIKIAEKIQKIDSKTARWIANDVKEAIQNLKNKLKTVNA